MMENKPTPKTSWRYKKSREPRIKEEMSKVSQVPDTVHELTAIIQSMCKRHLETKGPGSHRKGKAWWSTRIEALRKDYLRARRTLTRENRNTNGNPRPDTLIRHKSAYLSFAEEKKAAKNRLHERLCMEINKNPWGDAYRLAMKDIKPRARAKTPQNAEAVLRKLFPSHPPVQFNTVQQISTPTPFSVQELRKAALKLKTGKSPGPDGIPAEMVKLMADVNPELLLGPINRLLMRGEFPDLWKVATLKLLPKEGNTELCPKYRPICMINTTAKLLEHLINSRLIAEIELRKGISPKQHAFTPKKSCATAIEETVKFIETTKKRGPSWVPAIILLDVKNAFNSASWQVILVRLRHLKIDEYLITLIDSYFRDRLLNLDSKSIPLTSGVPQGSVLGPTLWNVLIDPVARIALPDYCDLILYADDIALLIGAKDGKEMRHRGNLALKRTHDKLTELGLELETAKSNALIVRGRRTSIAADTTFRIVDTEIRTRNSVKYLGVHLDTDMTFKKHAEETCRKATRSLNALSAILRTKHARMARRRVIARVVEGQLLYGSEVWLGRMTSAALKELETVQKRAAVTIARGLHSMSGEAALVLTGMCPIGLQAEMRQSKFRGTKDIESPTKKWQSRWQGGESTWTKSLIPRIEPWLKRTHGELSSPITEMLSGHGHFGSFLNITGKLPSASCRTCGTRESARHVLLNCPDYDGERTAAGLQGECDLRKIITKMLSSRREWDQTEALMYAIVKAGRLRLT